MEITTEIVRELLHYDPDAGVFTWKRRDRRWFKTTGAWKRFNKKYAGQRAGHVLVNAKGYSCRQIWMFGTYHYEHRLAWAWMTDEPLPPQIDHENRIGTDNRWVNLRAASRLLNSRNQSRRKDNTSGVVGVSTVRDSPNFRARCRLNGRDCHLGMFARKEDAEAAVRAFRERNGFSSGHGEAAHYHKGD